MLPLPDFFGATAATADAGRGRRAGGSVLWSRAVAGGGAVGTFALGVSREVGGETETRLGPSEIGAAGSGTGGSLFALLTGLTGIEPELDPAAGIPTSVTFLAARFPLGLFSASVVAPARGVKSGLFPISSIEPPASLSASSRSSAACFITVFSWRGAVSGVLARLGIIPPLAAFGGGGADAPIPMIVSLRTSPGRSDPGTILGRSEDRGRSETWRVAALTAASPASFSVA